jgi:hypothetical protein
MSNALTKEARTLLERASEMFEETGCVPGSDGEEVPAEMVPDAKKYILETIKDPEAFYDPEIWDTPGFTLVLSWLAQKWQQKCRKLAPRGGNKNAVLCWCLSTRRTLRSATNPIVKIAINAMLW